MIMAIAAEQAATGFGNSPGNPETPRVFLLRSDGAAHIFVQKSARRRLHPQRRHQVFEHRPSPGLQNGRAFVLNMRTVEMEPAFLWNFALGYSRKHRRAR